jgi:hypothetical protein
MTMQDEQDEMLCECCGEPLQPYEVTTEELAEWTRRTPDHIPFPLIDGACPRGWRRVTDTNGQLVELVVPIRWPNRKAMRVTYRDLLDVLCPGRGYAAVSQTETQACIGVFERVAVVEDESLLVH